MICILNTPE
ncbi:hypothetical protein CJF30_00011092 [Rutstroemia sp. NJR-2017a BBW]|nr:hypothetical protein CJF30_00011092 [Rutstroemia sp. NJR-2017a BBW]